MNKKTKGKGPVLRPRFLASCEFNSGVYGQPFYITGYAKNVIAFETKLKKYLRNYYGQGECKYNEADGSYEYMDGEVSVTVTNVEEMHDPERMFKLCQMGGWI